MVSLASTVDLESVGHQEESNNDDEAGDHRNHHPGTGSSHFLCSLLYLRMLEVSDGGLYRSRRHFGGRRV